MITLGMVSIREDFRRDGLAANFLADAELIRYTAESFPMARINIGYPGICNSEYRACEDILTGNQDVSAELCVVGHSRRDHVNIIGQLAQLHKSASANIWIPCSDKFIAATIGLPPTEVLENTKRMIDYWNAQYGARPLDVALADCTTEEPDLQERVVNWAEALLHHGARNVIVCDTQGVATPDAIHALFTKFDSGLMQRIEFHPHNDNGLAIENSLVALHHGVRYIGTSIYRGGERRTMLDPRSLLLYGLQFDPQSFAKFEKRYHQLIGNPDAVLDTIFGNNTIVTGTQYRLRDRDPSLRPLFGVTTDSHIVSSMLDIPPEEVSQSLLAQLKDRFLYEGKKLFLTAEELRAAVCTRGVSR